MRAIAERRFDRVSWLSRRVVRTSGNIEFDGVQRGQKLAVLVRVALYFGLYIHTYSPPRFRQATRPAPAGARLASLPRAPARLLCSVCHEACARHVACGRLRLAGKCGASCSLIFLRLLFASLLLLFVVRRNKVFYPDKEAYVGSLERSLSHFKLVA